MLDLHTHSTVSDGADAPAEVVRAAAAAGLSAVALTDHDAVDGVPEAMAAGARYGIRVIPAVELSAAHPTELHVLGYFIDIRHQRLTEAIRESVRVRRMRLADTCALLCGLGLPVTMEEIREKAAGGIPCRAHAAAILVEKGMVASVPEAFRLYLGPGCPAYANRQALTGEEAVSLIREAGGVPVLAHPNRMKMGDDEVRDRIASLIPYGLSGIEGYYSENTPAQQAAYCGMAEEYGLAVTGGTDYHGRNKPHIAIGRGMGNLAVPDELLRDLERRI